MSKKTTTAAEAHQLTDEEIGVELKRLRDEVYSLRTQNVTGKVEDNTRFAKTRQSIARLLTERNVRRHAKATRPVKAEAAEPAPKPKSARQKTGKPSAATRVSARAAGGKKSSKNVDKKASRMALKKASKKK